MDIRVYYEDTDAGGLVYHASYLRFAERARTEALRERGLPHAEMTERHGVVFLVRRVEMDYLAPARLDDMVTVSTSPVYLGSASVRLHQVCAVGSRPVAEAVVTLVCVRTADMRPARIPARWRDSLAGLMAIGSGTEG